MGNICSERVRVDIIHLKYKTNKTQYSEIFIISSSKAVGSTASSRSLTIVVDRI